MFRSVLSRTSQSTTAISSTRAQATLRATLLGLLAVLGSAGMAAAQQAPSEAASVRAKHGDAESLMLTVENPSQRPMHLQVTHLDNQKTILNEVNHDASHGWTLKFGTLPAGQYAVQVRVGHERYRYHVQVQALPQSHSTISVRELPAPTETPAIATAAL